MGGTYESSIFAPASIGQNKFLYPLCAWKTFSIVQLTLALSFKITSYCGSIVVQSSWGKCFSTHSSSFYNHALLNCLRMHHSINCLRLHRHFFTHSASLRSHLICTIISRKCFVNNQTHKPSPSSCMFLFTTSQTVFNIQKLPHRFRLTQNNVSIYFASFLKWRFHALTLRKL